MSRVAERRPRPTDIRDQKADTAWIFNGYDEDVEVTYLGRYHFRLPYGELTRIDTIVHEEPDWNRSSEDGLEYYDIRFPGEFIAREIVEVLCSGVRQQQGFAVFTEPNITEEQKRGLLETGKRYKLLQIEKFKADRARAKTGKGGYNDTPSKRMYRWLKEHAPDDEIFGEKRSKTDANAALAAAVEKLSGIFEMTVQKKALPKRPRRRPMESEEDYNARVVAWLDAMQKGKAATEESDD